MLTQRDMPGSGAMGSSLGNWEFLSQTNEYANCVPDEDRFKFVDDLSALEIINLINIGLSPYNMKNHIPSDIPDHGQFIESTHLKSQDYLQKINSWSEKHKTWFLKKKPKH